MKGKFDVIFCSPPYLQSKTKVWEEYRDNPKHALYAPNLTFHYKQVIDSLSGFIKGGSMVIIRVPRNEEKVRVIKAIFSNSFNLNKVVLDDILKGDSRFLRVQFL